MKVLTDVFHCPNCGHLFSVSEAIPSPDGHAACPNCFAVTAPAPMRLAGIPCTVLVVALPLAFAAGYGLTQLPWAAYPLASGVSAGVTIGIVFVALARWMKGWDG